MEIHPLGAIILGHDTVGAQDTHLSHNQDTFQRAGVLTAQRMIPLRAACII